MEINKNTIGEFRGSIINVFESYLYKHNIILKNQERSEAIKNGNAYAAIIYGHHYDMIGDTIDSCIKAGLCMPVNVDKIYSSFLDVLIDGEAGVKPSRYDQADIRRSITSIFINYNYKMGRNYNIE